MPKTPEIIQNKLDKVIDITTKKLGLLNELSETLKYEQCVYDLREYPKMSSAPRSFGLFHIATGRELKSGKVGEIRSYCRLRNIDLQTVYNGTELELEEPAKKVPEPEMLQLVDLTGMEHKGKKGWKSNKEYKK